MSKLPYLPARRSAVTGMVAALLVVALLNAPACKRPNGQATPKGETQAHNDTHDQPGQDHADHDHGDEKGHTDEATLTPEAQERYGVKVERAQRWILRPTFTAPGRVAFNQEAMAHVGSPLRGRAVEIAAGVNDAVTKGQALAVIESTELGEAQAELFQRRIAAASAEPAAELARVSWERARNLHEQSQGISLTEVQKREAEYRAALAAQKSAQAVVIGAENRLHLLGMSQEAIEALVKSGQVAPRFTITAPIAGTVVEREVTQGELVGPDGESLLVLADTTTLWVLAHVPEQRVAEIARGATAWVWTTSAAGKRYEGAVGQVSASVDPVTRTAQVRIVVPAAELDLKPGMFAQVEIVSNAPGGSEPEPVVAVPEGAIQTVEGAPVVFVPVTGEANTFAKRPVTVGPVTGGLVPIYAGLVEGESFVAAGSFILKAELGKGSAAHEH